MDKYDIKVGRWRAIEDLDAKAVILSNAFDCRPLSRFSTACFTTAASRWQGRVRTTLIGYVDCRIYPYSWSFLCLLATMAGLLRITLLYLITTSLLDAPDHTSTSNLIPLRWSLTKIYIAYFNVHSRAVL
jgi:hypothetical protein